MCKVKTVVFFLMNSVRCMAISLFIVMSCNQVAAQSESFPANPDTNRRKPVFSAASGIQHGFIFAHSPSVENTKGARPSGIEIILSWQRNDALSWKLCNCFPKNGLLLAYYDYDRKFLGKSITAAYMLEPLYKINKRHFFAIRGAAGVSFLTNPFDSITNPTNLSYSTQLTAYLLLGIGSWYRINKDWWLNLSVNYQHVSNGGMKQPNKGINWPTAGFAVNYQPGNRAYHSVKRTGDKFWEKKSLRTDIFVFGITRKTAGEAGQRKRLPLIGTGMQVAKQVGRINNLILGFEIFKDAALKAKLQQEAIPASAVKAGILAGHEFILGKFLFSQRLGIYVFDETPYYDRIYHRWGLHYRMNRNAGIGFNLQAHRQVADFIDLRFIYSFQNADN